MKPMPEPTVRQSLSTLLASDLDMFTVEEVADALRLNHVTVRRMLQEGDIGGYKFGGVLRISKQDLLNFLAASRRTPKSGL